MTELFPIFLLPRSIRWQPSYHSQDLKSAASLGYFESKANITSLSKELVNERQLQGPFIEESMAEARDDAIKFYTGLPNFKILKAIYDHTYKTLPNDGITKLTAFQEFMSTMLKLRMNTSLEDLAYRFRISSTTMSRIF